MQIIKTTLISTIIGCLTFGIFTLFEELSFRYFLYVTIMISGSLIVPVFLGVLIYEFVKRWVNENGGWLNFIFRVIIFGTLVQVAMVVWAILDVILYYGDFSGLTIENIIKDYKKEFLPYMLVVVFISILIPMVDKNITRRTYRNK